MNDAPQRMTLSRVVELLLTRSARTHSSVTITRSSSGTVGFDVTIATGDTDEVVTAEQASALCQTIADALIEKYPPPPDHDNADASYTRNAKGETQIAVSAKTTPTGNRKLAELVNELRTVYDRERMRYPMADGHTAKPGSVK